MKSLVLLAAVLSAFVSLHARAGNAAQHLAEAVRFRTISHQDTSKVDKSSFLAFHEYLRQTYPKAFTQLDVQVINELSLMLIWRGADDSRLPVLFTAHMDVVPIEPGTENGWTHPGFAGVIDDGFIYGRGTLDDKIGVISLLEATEQLLGEGFTPQRSVALAFGHDEEVSGPSGAGKIAERMADMGMHFSWMVDEGGMIISDSAQTPGFPFAMVNVAEKTYLTLKLTATGQGGHSSMPLPHSSVGKLAAALARIESNPFDARLEEPVRSMLERLAPYADFPQSLILSNLWLTAPFVVRSMQQSPDTNAMVRTTTAVTMFNGGVKENVIPQQAVAYVNFRLLPGDTVDGVRARIDALVDDPDIRVEPTIKQPDTPPVADIAGEGFTVISQAVAAVYPQAVVVPSLLVGATDTRHYTHLVDDIYRFQGFAIPMADTGAIHGTDEKVAIESLEKAVDIATEMLRLGGT